MTRRVTHRRTKRDPAPELVVRVNARHLLSEEDDRLRTRLLDIACAAGRGRDDLYLIGQLASHVADRFAELIPDDAERAEMVNFCIRNRLGRAILDETTAYAIDDAADDERD
jgi:hypothetical protein